MKRDPALARLSREHHHTLVMARRLRDATAESAAADASAFLEQWDREERLHFRLEEEVLLPAYAAHASPEHPLIARMLCDHVLIRRDAARVAQCPEPALLHDLGGRLDSHVRLEEREVFPLIEGAIPEDELRALGERLLAGEGAPAPATA
ncbi:MAG: hemerythrin domain-containing protein [Acidobacteriota bacterium]|nr:hemerythrin domain-containing protein [Acidobacteriota bacterium]